MTNEKKSLVKEPSQPVFETSLLFEPQAFWGMLALLALAVWFSFWPLLLVSLFLLLLFALITGWKKASLKAVVPTFSLQSNRIFAGNFFHWTATLHNGKWLPLVWAEWTFADSEGLQLATDHPDLRTLRFLWIMWHGEASWTEKGKAVRRGVYDLGNIQLISGDGFRFSENVNRWQLPGEIYVYPQILPVQIQKLQLPRQWSAEGPKGGIFEDPLLLRGVREYIAGDELRRVNWKASARAGKLHTSLFQTVVSKELMFFIDVAGFSMGPMGMVDEHEEVKAWRQRQLDFEAYLSLIASMAMQHHRNSTRLGFMSNALDHRDRPMEAVAPRSDYHPFMDSLAKMTEITASGQNVTPDRLLHSQEVRTPLYLCCREITLEHYEWVKRRRRQFPELRVFYQKESPYSALLPDLCQSLNSIRQ